MNHTPPNLQIRIHKVDATTTTFVQPDAAEAKKILDGFSPARMFDRDSFVIADGNFITSLPVSKITRLDLVSDHLAHLVFPVGVVNAVELAEREFQALIRNPVMRQQWERLSTRDDSLVTFLDLEMADGQCLYLTMEVQVALPPAAPWQTNWFPLAGSSLCFRMRTGGVAVLNLANLVRLTFFPKPAQPVADAWPARRFYPPPPAPITMNLQLNSTTNQRSKQHEDTSSKLEGKHQ